MPHARQHALRRRLAVLVLGVLTVIAAEVSLPVSSLAPGTATAAADSGSSVRPQPPPGRVRPPRPGVRDGPRVRSRPVRRGRRAVAQGRRRRGLRPGGAAEGFRVRRHRRRARTARTLHRRWIAAVNYCASQPDRSLAAVRDAPQCASPASIYVTLSETEGRYDECLTRRPGSRRSPGRPPRTARRWPPRSPPGSGVRSPGPDGMLLVGDSVSWRGSDELARLRPELTVDAEPARRPTELAARLDAFRAEHGQPAGLVVELGTNPAPGFQRRDLAAARPEPPDRTAVMLVLPYVEVSSDPMVVVVVVAAVRRLDALRRRRPSAHLRRGLAGVRRGRTPACSRTAPTPGTTPRPSGPAGSSPSGPAVDRRVTRGQQRADEPST